jgi:peptidoglycan-associated lipoprotein
MNRISTSHAWIAAAALLLAGCASKVKLDEAAPVESRTPSAVGTSPGGASPGAAQGQAGAQSQVTPVDLTRGGAASPNANVGRVVYFDFDSYVVRDEFRGMIDAHARALTGNKGKRMVVEGHADERGGREYNLALGQKRAEAVVKSMELLGAQSAQLEAVSFGKERPVDEGHDEAAWAKNRRAELKDK